MTHNQSKRFMTQKERNIFESLHRL